MQYMDLGSHGSSECTRRYMWGNSTGLLPGSIDQSRTAGADTVIYHNQVFISQDMYQGRS